MRRSWSGREPWWLLACGALALSPSGCGGQEFTAGPGSGASAGTAPAGGKANAGSGGSSAGDESMAGSPDTGGSPSMGGSGGSAPTTCNCGPGRYCRDATKDCFECAELSRLRFTPPERLETLSSGNQAPHFPRAGESKSDLLYSVAGAGMLYTTDFSTSAGSSVAQSSAQDSGPLLLAASVMLTEGDFNFAFDRGSSDSGRELYFGQWQGGLAITAPAPAPYNGSADDFSIAIAASSSDDSVARAYWMSSRDGPAKVRLMTALLAPSSTATPVSLDIGQAGCPPAAVDLTPWVTPDGAALFFSHIRLDGCADTRKDADLYQALLQPNDGQPTAPAIPISDVNGPGNDVEPSFSSDMCELYFASDRDGDFALYRSRRR